jgi:cystathionine beta-lyase
MNKAQRPRRPGTVCVHAGTHADSETGGICTPIYPSTSYAYPNPADTNYYPRYFNVPNQRVVADKLAALEHGEDALVFGSGMAGISTFLFAYLRPGDHALLQTDLYGGTFHFATDELPALGMEVSFCRTLEEMEAAVRPTTRLVYIESPSNPLLRCIDIQAVAAFARARGIVSAIDNTFASPINQNPLLLGIDVVMHSATKYLNGHSDVNAGVLVSSRAVVDRCRGMAVNHGGTLDAHACSQLERGLKTLALRVARQNDNAMALARFLEGHPAVARVNYPGLASHPQHGIAARQMRGFGGMLSFELRDPARVDALLAGFKLVTPALSLGGVESLICAPSRTSHRSLSPEQRASLGISEGLLRVSAGIEDAEDIQGDFSQALESRP